MIGYRALTGSHIHRALGEVLRLMVNRTARQACQLVVPFYIDEDGEETLEADGLAAAAEAVIFQASMGGPGWREGVSKIDMYSGTVPEERDSPAW